MTQRKRHPLWLCGLAAAAMTIGSLSAAEDGAATPGSIEPAKAAHAGPVDVVAPVAPVSPPAADPRVQLAAARQELDELLTDTGLLPERDRQAQAARLEQLAELGRTLRRQAPADHQLAVADLDLRANYALAQHARSTGQEREAGYRVGRLRTVAMTTRNLQTPGAAVLGDFWLMQADLFDLSGAGLDLDTRQRETIRRLEQFVSEHGSLLTAPNAGVEPAIEAEGDAPADSDILTEPAEDPAQAALAGTPAPQPAEPSEVEKDRDPKDQKRAQLKDLVESLITEPTAPAPGGRQAEKEQPMEASATPPPAVGVTQSAGPANRPFDFDVDAQRALVTEVQLALLRLYDERGLSDQVREAVDTLRRTAQRQGDQSLEAELDRWYGYRDALGRVFAARVPTIDGEVWSSSDHRGKVIVLHFWADWYQPSAEAFSALAALHRQYGDAKVAILSIDMGGAPAAATPEAGAWPVTRDAAARQQLVQLLAVRTLPRYVVIDRRGVVVRAGSSLAGVAEYLKADAARVPDGGGPTSPQQP